MVKRSEQHRGQTASCRHVSDPAASLAPNEAGLLKFHVSVVVLNLLLVFGAEAPGSRSVVCMFSGLFKELKGFSCGLRRSSEVVWASG